jgi:hypothetical protein
MSRMGLSNLIRAAGEFNGYELIGEIHNIETIARGPSVHQRGRLTRRFGKGNWRKLKGVALVRGPGGIMRWTELHWFEAHGIGKKEIKVKHSF